MATLILIVGCVPDRPGALLAGGKSGTVDWAPGDPIPGWEDYDCPEPGDGANEIVMEIPGYYYAYTDFGIDYTTGRSPLKMFASLTDCVERGCSDGTRDPNADIGFMVDEGHEPAPRGLGWYLPDGDADTEPYVYFGRVRSNFVPYAYPWVDPYDHRAAKFSVCISRSGPDGFRGSVFMDNPRYDWSVYPAFRYSFAMDLRFGEGSGSSPDGDPGCDRNSDGPHEGTYGGAYYGTDYPYDEVWPWDEITDSAIRDHVYAAYYPCQSP
jgi:hypothetical protein